MGTLGRQPTGMNSGAYDLVQTYLNSLLFFLNSISFFILFFQHTVTLTYIGKKGL